MNDYEFLNIKLLEAILKGVALLIIDNCKDKELADSYYKYANSTIKLSKTLAAEEKVRVACDIMNSYLEASVTYEMTEPVIVDRSLIGTWITVDQNMEVVFQTDLIKAWLEEFGNKYDTVGATRTFTTPDGRATQVSGGTYGWSIDEETELTNLKNS